MNMTLTYKLSWADLFSGSHLQEKQEDIAVLAIWSDDITTLPPSSKLHGHSFPLAITQNQSSLLKIIAAERRQKPLWVEIPERQEEQYECMLVTLGRAVKSASWNEVHMGAARKMVIGDEELRFALKTGGALRVSMRGKLQVSVVPV